MRLQLDISGPESAELKSQGGNTGCVCEIDTEQDRNYTEWQAEIHLETWFGC